MLICLGLLVLQRLTILSATVCFFCFSEELRGEISQDACMCEAQILFQKKVQFAIQELMAKHIL